MRTDDVAGLQGTLGLIEDDMAEMQPWYSQAAGDLAAFEKWERVQYVQTMREFKDRGHWPKGTTETEKKVDVEAALVERNRERYEQIEEIARLKAMGDKLFALLDARRSIAQTAMKPHLADEPRFGQGARGQHGTREPVT